MLLYSEQKNKLFHRLQVIAREVFKVALLTLLVAYVVEDMWPGFVTNAFSMNFLLWLTVITGVVTVAVLPGEPATTEKPKRSGKREYIMAGIVSIVSIGILYYRLHEITRFGWVIAVLSGLIVFLITISFTNEDINDEPSK